MSGVGVTQRECVCTVAIVGGNDELLDEEAEVGTYEAPYWADIFCEGGRGDRGKGEREGGIRRGGRRVGLSVCVRVIVGQVKRESSRQ